MTVLATFVFDRRGVNIGGAVLGYLLVIVLVGRLGATPVVVVGVTSCIALNVWFIAPIGSFQLVKSENVAPFLAFAIASIVCLRRDVRAVGPELAWVVVAAATGALLVFDASLVVAATTFTGIVVVVALLGSTAAAVSVVSSYVALNFWFTPPYESLEITKFEDLVPLIMFVVVAAVSAGTVARIDWLRRRQVEIERKAFDAQLSSALNESRAAFLATMTHNLRTPLATIKAVIYEVAASSEGQRDRQAAQLLETAGDEIDRLERLVTKVLELGRIHAGALEPHVEPTDAAELARVASRRLRTLARQHDLRLAVDSQLLIVMVDPAMIELVLVIALENAIRFAPKGSEVLVRASAAPNGRCEIRVADHGPGIAPGDRERIFEEFVRLDPSTQGSGLGLTIARAIVEAHGGRIWVEPTPGGGATIAFSLPGGEEE